MSDWWVQKCKNNEKNRSGHYVKCPSNISHQITYDQKITNERSSFERLKLG
jgi:hypothetical protein